MTVTGESDAKEKPSIAISACLAGIACRYDGQPKTNVDAMCLVQEKKRLRCVRN